MSLKELKKLKLSYETHHDAVLNDFYIPCLKEAVLYQRAVGFFSAQILVDFSIGLCSLAKRSGKIQLIVSHRIDEDVFESIKKGYDMKDEIGNQLLEMLEKSKDGIKVDRFDLLANMIADGFLDIRVALVKGGTSTQMFHQKIGIITDSDGNSVAFTGSNNETINGLIGNSESFDVFYSWTDPVSEMRCEQKKESFEKKWINNDDCVEVIKLPQIVRAKLISFKNNTSSYLKLDEKFIAEYEKKRKRKDIKLEPSIDKYNLFKYQKEAISEWEKNNFCGIYNMATGSGKTITGIASIVDLYKKKKRLFVVIVVPYLHLVDQWVQDLENCNIHAQMYHSKIASKDNNMKRKIRNFKFNKSNFECVIITNASFRLQRFQDYLDTNINETLLLVDEAHNIGASGFKDCLVKNYAYKLGLSATIERYGDEEGTNRIYKFFNKICFEYTLYDAIVAKKLTPYKYHPVVVNLGEDELEEYVELSKKISKYMSNSNTRKNFPPALKQLLIKRARLIASSQNKLLVFLNNMKKFKDSNNILIYCGAVKYDGTQNLEDDSSEIRQISFIQQRLSEQYDMVTSKFTADESLIERQSIVKSLTDKRIQAIVAIKCLDEGVNIPSVQTAFLLASSTNPKEYIQRRGRVLRKSEGKTEAEIYDYIVLSRTLDEANNLSSDDLKHEKGLAIRELSRISEFSGLSINPSDSYELINQIKSAYKLNIIKGEKLWEE